MLPGNIFNKRYCIYFDRRVSNMRTMKKWLSVLLIAAVAFVLATGCSGGGGGDGASSDSDTVYEWKIQCIYPPGDQCYDIQMPMICEAITEATDGQIQFEYYQPGAICEPEQTPSSLSKGLLDAAICAPSETVQMVPAAYAEQGVPFYWENGQDVYDNFYDYGLLDFCRETYEKAGIYYGMYVPNGAYMLMTDFQINSGDDLKGKKIRASTSYATMVELMGGAPVSMNGGDIYMGMKLGTINGYIYTVAELEMSALKEVTSNVMEPAACGSAPVNLIFSKKSWDSLTPELQEIVNETMQDIFMDVYNESITFDKDSMDAAKDYGVVFTTVDDAGMQAFYDAGRQVKDKLSQQYPDSAPGFELIQQWKDAKDAGETTGSKAE